MPHHTIACAQHCYYTHLPKYDYYTIHMVYTGHELIMTYVFLYTHLAATTSNMMMLRVMAADIFAKHLEGATATHGLTPMQDTLGYRRSAVASGTEKRIRTRYEGIQNPLALDTCT